MAILYGNGFESMYNYQWNGYMYKQYTQLNDYDITKINTFDLNQGINKITIDDTSNKIYFTNNYDNTINQINSVSGSLIFSSHIPFNPPTDWQYQSSPFGTSGYYYNPQTLIFPYGVPAGIWMIKDIYIDHNPSSQTAHIDADDGSSMYVNGNLQINSLKSNCCKIVTSDVTSYLHKGWNRIQIIGQNGWLTGGGPGVLWANLEVDGTYLITDGGVQNSNTWNLDTSKWWYIQILHPTSTNQPDPNWYLPMYGQGPDNIEIIQDLVYVSCYGGQLYLIDGNNGNILKNLNIQDHLSGLQINKKENKIYVLNSPQNNLSIINGSNGTNISTITTENYPVSVVQNRDNIYVLNENSNNINIIDTTTNSIIETIDVNSKPLEMQLNHNTNLLYVLNNTSNNISVIDVITNDIIKTISNITSPNSITINENTNTIFVIGNNDTLYIINGISNEVIKTITLETGINDIKINKYSNELYITNTTNNYLTKYQVNMTTFENIVFNYDYNFLQKNIFISINELFNVCNTENIKILNDAIIKLNLSLPGYITSPIIDLKYRPAQITINLESAPQNEGIISLYRGSNTQPNSSPDGTIIGSDNIQYDYWNDWNNVVPSDYITISQYNVGNNTYRYIQYKIILENDNI